ncbi:MAG TPA: GAF domain-containing protein [Roseomonas sp.]
MPTTDREDELLRQQSVLARFGELALRSDDLQDILQEACRLVGEALGTDLAKVMELQEDGTTLLVKAGVYWPAGVVGEAKLKAEKGSSEGHALHTGEAVISPDIDAEERFTYADFIREAGVRALVNVLIIGPKDQPPYGILQVDSRQPREFTDQDIQFLRGYANLLAAAVDRLRKAQDMRVAEVRLRESEERFQQFSAASSDVLWIRNAETMQFEYISPAFEMVYGVSRTRILDGDSLQNWAELILPEDREQVIRNFVRVQRGESVNQVFRIERPSDGDVRWVHDTDFPLLDEAGRVQRIGGIGHDVTEEKGIAGRLDVLVAELQHRTRNIVAVVRAIANKTLASSSSLSDFGNRFQTRLEALSRVNGLLSRLESSDRIAFDELIRAELAAHGVLDGAGSGPKVTLKGPPKVHLRSSTVQTLALALHELATNALKYGALGKPEGELSISWHVVRGPDGERRLRVEWEERGLAVPPATESGPRRGYGRELIERALPYQLEAKTRYELSPEGVRCSISLPISTRTGSANA